MPTNAYCQFPNKKPFACTPCEAGTSWHVGAVLVRRPPTPWHLPVLPPGAEWAGRGWLASPGCPAAQDSCLGSQRQLPRTHHHLTAQEHSLQGTRGLEGHQIPVLHSSLYFLVTVPISDSDCFISATWIFLKKSTSEWPYINSWWAGAGQKLSCVEVHWGRELFSSDPTDERRKGLTWNSIPFLPLPEHSESWVWEVRSMMNPCSYQTQTGWGASSQPRDLAIMMKRSIQHPLWAESCPPKICMLKPYPLVPQNMSKFGGRAFKDVIKLKRGH